MIFLITKNKQHRLFKNVLPDDNWDEVIKLTNGKIIVDCIKSSSLRETDFNSMFLSLIYEGNKYADKVFDATDSAVFS